LIRKSKHIPSTDSILCYNFLLRALAQASGERERYC
jgi:hypothetical protein